MSFSIDSMAWLQWDFPEQTAKKTLRQGAVQNGEGTRYIFLAGMGRVL